MSNEVKLKFGLQILKKLGMEGEALSKLVAKEPHLLCSSEKKVVESFKHVDDIGFKNGTKAFFVALHNTIGVDCSV
jgi:hypothetical protein